MFVNLTKKQEKMLMKNKNVRVKPEQLSENMMGTELFLDGKEKSKFRAALKNNRGMIIKSSMVQGDMSGMGFNKVMKNVQKSIKKEYNKNVKPELKSAYKETKSAVKGTLKDIFGDIKETARASAKMKVQKEKAKATKKLMENNFIDEEKAESLLRQVGIPSDLADDLITKSNMKLRDSSLRQLNNLETNLINTLDRVGAVKGEDYEIEDMNDEEIVGMGMRPKKRGVHRVVYVKGGSAKSFFKKIGKTIGKVLQNKQVGKIVKDLGVKGLSVLGSLAGIPPSVTQTLSKPLVDMAVNETGDALAGLGVLTQKKTVLGLNKTTRGGAMYHDLRRGGAMFASRGGSNLGTVHTGKYFI